MNAISIITRLFVAVSSVLLFFTNTDTSLSFPGNLVLKDAIQSPIGKDKRLDEPPQETYNPSSLPFYQVPLSLAPHDHFLLSRPINDETISWRTADYRYGYLIKKDGYVHTGLDIPAPERTAVLAAGDGTVVFSGYGLLLGEGAKNDPYGIAVMIKHDFFHEHYTIYTVYTHLDKAVVKINDVVTTGQKIGGVGMTGNTSGPHLHFEVRIQDDKGMSNQNPELWLVPPMDHGVLAGRITNNLGYLLNNWNIWLTSLDTGNEWQVRAYARPIVDDHKIDPFYAENFVLNDLPAGRYELLAFYNSIKYKYEFEIVPGAVNYVLFKGKQGFSRGDPPGSENTDFLN